MTLPNTALDLQLCDACAATYVADALATWNTGDVHVFLTRLPEAWIIAFKGSVSLRDWFDDFKAVPRTTITDPVIGEVHSGFLDDVSEVYVDMSHEVQAHLGDARLYLTGHSKGGAEAEVCAAMFLSEGFRVDRLTTFGAPRVGLLGNLLANLVSPGCGSDYRYSNDPVPTVPSWLAHPRPVTHIGPAYRLLPRVDSFPDHHLPNYRGALAI